MQALISKALLAMCGLAVVMVVAGVAAEGKGGDLARNGMILLAVWAVAQAFHAVKSRPAMAAPAPATGTGRASQLSHPVAYLCPACRNSSQASVLEAPACGRCAGPMIYADPASAVELLSGAARKPAEPHRTVGRELAIGLRWGAFLFLALVVPFSFSPYGPPEPPSFSKCLGLVVQYGLPMLVISGCIGLVVGLFKARDRGELRDR